MKKIINFENDDDIGFELFAIYKKNSNLSTDLYAFDSETPSILNESVPCLFVEDPNKKFNMIKVSISDNPEIIDGIFEEEFNFTEVFEFIKRTKDGLLRIWNTKDSEEYSSYDFYKEYLKEPK